MRINDVKLVAATGAFTHDDLASIRAGARRDGFFYTGRPLTSGFKRVREPSEAVSTLVVLDDGRAVYGDGVAVQYAGGAGRGGPVRAADACRQYAHELRDTLIGREITSFRAIHEVLDNIGSTPVRYSASQALLAAAAHATCRTMAEVVQREYNTGANLRPIPVFAQCGESRYDGVDRMILRQADELPHGLVNNAESLVGVNGELLRAYVVWVRDRVLEMRSDEAYSPTLHFDCYGTLGEVFGTTDACVGYLAMLSRAASPFPLRIEQPVMAGSRGDQIDALRSLCEALERSAIPVEIVADEWCNTLEDVTAFADAGAGDVLQVKTPDVGSLDDTIRSILRCRKAGVKAYCGGSSTDTERAAQICAQVAMGAGADLILARPGMGIDEALMVTRNEMARVEALAGATSTGGG